MDTLFFRPSAVESSLHNNVYDNDRNSSLNQTNYQQRQDNVNFRKKEKDILDEVLGSSKYDSRIRPAGMQNDASEYIPYI